MGQTLDIGRRIELVPMDTHFHDISIALYRRLNGQEPLYRVHTYSLTPGAPDRIAFVIQAMQTLGGMERTPDGLLRFPCGAEHTLGCKRLFLEACKLDPSGEPAPRPPEIFDKKSNGTIRVLSLGEGVYQVAADGDSEGKEKRLRAITGGLAKLGEMDEVDGTLDQASFACGHAHDALVSLLLVRAPNVRSALREAEMAAARGVLMAPSQQK